MYCVPIGSSWLLASLIQAPRCNSSLLVTCTGLEACQHCPQSKLSLRITVHPSSCHPHYSPRHSLATYAGNQHMHSIVQVFIQANQTTSNCIALSRLKVCYTTSMPCNTNAINQSAPQFQELVSGQYGSAAAESTSEQWRTTEES